MKILGTETRRNENVTFSLSVVDNLDSVYTVLVKNSFWNTADNYKRYIYTNGTAEKTSLKKDGEFCKVKFKVVDGDWLIICTDMNNMVMYISEQYCGPVKVKNKKVQQVIDSSYEYCRERLESKRNFAKKMGAISRKLNMPFQIVLAFKGDEELLNQLMAGIENAIKNDLYDDANLMRSLASKHGEKREKAIRNLGVTFIPRYQSEKIAAYILECLVNKKIIRRIE